MKGMAPSVWCKVAPLVQIATRFSADFQIFSYRILSKTRTRKCLDKEAELSRA